MFIDLHAHTQKCKEGDGDSRQISPIDFVAKIQNHKVKICAITNHNKFDLDEYDEVLKQKPDFQLFPGIELDVSFEGDHYHIILICSPAKKKEFDKTFNGIKRNLETFIMPIDDMITAIKKFASNEIIAIPHFMNKQGARSISEECKAHLEKELSGYVIILEPANTAGMGILNRHEEFSLMGSDVKDWGHYSDIQLPELKFEIDSFEKFQMLAKDKTYLQRELLDKQERIDIEVESNSVKLYKDVNIIFGGKGSGKSWFIEKYIEPNLTSKGLKVSQYKGDDSKENYKEMIKDHVDSIEVDNQIKDNFINAFDSIKQYSETGIITKPEDYYKYWNDKNSHKLIKANATISSSRLSFENCLETFTSQLQIVSETNKLNAEIERDTVDADNLSKELKKLFKDITKTRMAEFNQIFIDKMTDKFVSTIKSSVEKKKGVKVKPKEIGLSKLLDMRLDFAKNMEVIKQSHKNMNCDKHVELGFLPEKGKVTLCVEIRSMNKKSNLKEFKSNKESKECIKQLLEFSLHCFGNITDYCSKFKDIKPDEFLDKIVIRKDFITDGKKNEFEPSSGQQSILTLTEKLENTNYDWYLFDEIERGLGHQYISDYIIPKIKHLRNLNKGVVLSTHNANIAVSILPSQTLFCEVAEDIYRHYYGNMYNNELINIDDEGDIKDWNECAIVHLEGSDKLFNIRRNAYGI